MAVNPAIAMGVQPLQLADPLTQYGRFAAIQQAQNQNALAQYQLGAARREEAANNALNEAYRAAYDPQTGAVDMNRLRQTLATGGFGSKLPGIEKSMADMEEQRLKRDAAKTALADVKLKQARSFLDTIDPADPTAPEKFMAWHEANHRDPVLGPLLEARGVTADQSRGRIQQAIQQGPQAFAQLLLQSKVGTEKFMEMNKTPAPPVDVATMQALGFPLTPQGYAQYRDSQRQERMLSPEEEAQRIRIARESRPLPQPREPKGPGSPVAVVDPETQRTIFVTPEEALQRRMTPASATEGLAPKEIQKREASYPKTTAALRSFETQADTLVANLTKLRDHPGLSGITGFVFGRTPAITAEARSAKADLDNILARGGFAELTAMRQASPTGGALGNISNKEVEYLRDAFGALNTVQDTETFKQKINDVITQLQTSKRNVREEYDNTYEYRAQRAAAAGGAPAPGGFPKPPQAAIDQLKSGKGTDAQFDEIFGPGAAARARRQ